MKTKKQRLNELYSKGLVNTIKGLFAGKNVNIDEDYYALMADYIDSLDEVKDSMILNPVEILNNLPNLVSNIQETNLNGIYGITDENSALNHAAGIVGTGVDGENARCPRYPAVLRAGLCQCGCIHSYPFGFRSIAGSFRE